MAKRLLSLDTKEIAMAAEALKMNGFQGAVRQYEAWKLGDKLEKSLKRITVASAKQKGRKLQQEACEMVSRITGIQYKSGEDGLIESRGMGQNGVDVALRGEAREKFPYSIECKATESLNLLEAIQQAKENMYEGTDWLLIHDRKKMSEPVVIMSMSAFEALFEVKNA